MNSLTYTRVMLVGIALVGALTSAGAQEQRPWAARQLTLPAGPGVSNAQLSPDGRWLAFNTGFGAPGDWHVWIAPLAGGAPVRLTARGRFNRPTWFPAGDRLAFYSMNDAAVFTLRINPQTGAAVGGPMRVTVDTVAWGLFDVSPDGNTIAYATSDRASRAIRVIPSTGGPARTVASADVEELRFSADGRSILAVVGDPSTPPPSVGRRSRLVQRINVADGAMSTMFRIPEGRLNRVNLDPLADRVLVRRGDIAHALTLRGDSIATIPFSKEVADVRHLTFSRDGATAYLLSDVVRQRLHVVPLDGGESRAVGPPGREHSLVRWSPTGIFYRDRPGGYRAEPDSGLSVVQPDGRGGRRIPAIPPSRGIESVSPDGRYLVIVDQYTPSGWAGLSILDTQTGRSRRVTAALSPRVRFERVEQWYDESYHVSWSYRVRGDEVFYGVEIDGNFEVRAARFSGGDRMVHTLAIAGLRGSRGGAELFLDVRGDQLAWETPVGRDSVAIVLKVGGTAPRRVMQFKWPATRSIQLSPDGTMLAVGIDDETKRQLWFVSTRPNGAPAPARPFDSPLASTEWAPDSRSVVVLGRDNAIWRVPAAPPHTPVRLPARVPAGATTFLLAPDGREIVVPVPQHVGAGLWRINLRQTVPDRP